MFNSLLMFAFYRSCIVVAIVAIELFYNCATMRLDVVVTAEFFSQSAINCPNTSSWIHSSIDLFNITFSIFLINLGS